MTGIWPFRNFGLKALSLAMGVLMWLAVSGEEPVERGLRVPLELQQLPVGLELTGDVPTTVDVRVRGGSGVLSRVGPGDVLAVLDLRSARAGQRLFPLTPDQIRKPFGVEVAQVTPSAVAIMFEASATKRVPVVPAVDGRPAPGFVVGPMTSDPAAVEVAGPESVVKRATLAVTEPVTVSGARSLVRENVVLGLLDPSLRIRNARSATVTVQILPAPIERTIRNRPVRLRNLGQNMTAVATPTAADVTVRGSREAMDAADFDEVAVTVDLAGLGPGDYPLRAHVTAPGDVGVVRVEPQLVKVRIASAR